MTPDQRLLAIAALVSATAYLAGVFFAGLTLGNPWAWKLALATMGVCFLSYAAQIVPLSREVCIVLTLSTLALGVAAGVALLVR